MVDTLDSPCPSNRQTFCRQGSGAHRKRYWLNGFCPLVHTFIASLLILTDFRLERVSWSLLIFVLIGQFLSLWYPKSWLWVNFHIFGFLNPINGSEWPEQRYFFPLFMGTACFQIHFYTPVRKKGRIIPWQYPSVRLSVRLSFPNFFSCNQAALWMVHSVRPSSWLGMEGMQVGYDVGPTMHLWFAIWTCLQYGLAYNTYQIHWPSNGLMQKYCSFQPVGQLISCPFCYKIESRLCLWNIVEQST